MKVDRITELEKKYVMEALENGFRSRTNYALVKRLEDAFAKKIGSTYAIAFVNGTATLHIALEASGVRIGDEVITTPLTMSATGLAILHANAIPVFADVDPDTYQITAKAIEKKITPRTKAIIIVSLFGLIPEMDGIMALAEKHGLSVIEDDAQCFLGKYKGRTAGTIGDLSSFSFQSSKHITCGEGGIITTDNEDLALKVRRYSGLGYAGINTKKGRITKDDIQSPDYDRHVVLGWNYRMSDVTGGVALAQTERMEELCNVRVRSALLFEEAISECAWLTKQRTPSHCENAYWAAAFKLDTSIVSWNEFRQRYMEFGGDGIYAAWKLTYQEPAFRDRNFLGREKIIDMFGGYECHDGLCPVAEELQKSLLLFKTNYWSDARAKEQAEILQRTWRSFEE